MAHLPFSLILDGQSDLPEQFQQNIFIYIEAQELLSDISIYYRRRAAARRAALYIIARYGEGDLAVFPRDMIKLIAKEVWKTRLDDVWLDASEESNRNSLKRIKHV